MSTGRPRRSLEHLKVRAALERLRRGEPRTRCDEPPSRTMLDAIEQFNAGEFFDQHETFEDMWRAETGDIRFLYQGILHVGVGFYHLQKGNYHGAITKLGTGVAMLEHFQPACMGVDVTRLILDAATARGRLVELGEGRIGEFPSALVPKVHVLPTDRQEGEVAHS
jgi:predicted metal-dependent hydrolase